MTFEERIKRLTLLIFEKQNKIDIKRIETIEHIVLIMFHSFKKKDFSESIIKAHDIHNSICRLLHDDDISLVNLTLLNVFISNLSKYELKIDYIIKNQVHLSDLINCEQDKKFIA